MFQSPIINPNSQDSGGLGALNQMQQPAPSLLNQQVPGVQQTPMQQPAQQQPGFSKSGFFPFSPALDSVGNPVTQLPSPELPFYETGVGRVFPGGIGGGMSQPGFSGAQPTLQPRVPNVNPDQNPNWQWGNTGGPLTSPFTNQPPNPLRPNIPQPTFAPSDGMPFGGIGGRPFASQQTPEDFQRMQDYRNQDLINQGIRANQGMPMGRFNPNVPRQPQMSPMFGALSRLFGRR